MKLTKRVLSMVLCGLVVLGGSQAALVKADAQTVIAAGNNQYTGKWTQGVRLGMQLKGFSGTKSGWSLKFVHDNGHLRLEGPSNVGSTWTFGDTFHLGFVGQDGKKHETVFRTGNGPAGPALKRAMEWFNGSNVKDGDIVFCYGESWQTSVTFDGPSMIKGILGNDYRHGYQNVNRKDAGFRVDNGGLYEARVSQHVR